MFGRYRIDEIAGHGTTSVVYRASDTAAGRTVALKCLREELLVPAERDATLARFRQEAALGERLAHPGIVRLFEQAEQDRLPYIAMEHVAGESFDSLIRRAGPLPLPVLCPIVIDILGALAHAHACSVVHRDVKPANILMRSAGSDPVLTDFGIARIGRSDLTQAGDLLGSPAFMAPEQIRGGGVDHRADLFAAGVVLYLAATGRLPFDGSIAEVMYQICYGEPAPPSRLDPALAPLDQIVAKALAKDPRDRYASAAAYMEALESVRPTQARGTGAAGAVATLLVASLPAGRVPSGGGERDPASTVVSAARRVRDDRAARENIVSLSRTLARQAPLPGRPVSVADWLDGIRRLGLLLQAAEVGPGEAEAAAARDGFVRRVTADTLVHSGRVTNRLFADEAPYAASFVDDLASVDAVGEALGLLRAGHERRLVEAFGHVLVGQILRRAADFMETYARTRDPVTRFDVLNMLVHAEDLVGLAGRLARHAVGGAAEKGAAEKGAAEEEDAVVQFSRESLSAFVDGIGALVAVAETDLSAALEAGDAASVDEFIRHLRQIRLVYRFVARLEGGMFRDRLADLSRRIHHLFARLTATITASAITSSSVQEQATALYEMADGLGWHELAGRLLERLRLSALAADATPPAPALVGPAATAPTAA
jgi:serine/threonine-protein kinase